MKSTVIAVVIVIINLKSYIMKKRANSSGVKFANKKCSAKLVLISQCVPYFLIMPVHPNVLI